MGGGYAPDLAAIVSIHANTLREAARRVCPPAPATPSLSS
jgi:hypothetical protein